MTSTAGGAVVGGTPPARLELAGVRLGDSPVVDLRVEAGELVALAGEAGPDLLWAAAGRLRPTEGRVLIDGQPIVEPHQAYALGTALIPQGNGLAQLLTALENVLLPLTADGDPAAPWSMRTSTAGADGSRAELAAGPLASARRALDAVGLTDSADHLIEELSGGQQQRVAIARALALRPRLLLADQATTDLDAGTRARVLGLLRDLAAAGSAVLLASDDPHVGAACDRVVLLDAGDGAVTD